MSVSVAKAFVAMVAWVKVYDEKAPCLAAGLCENDSLTKIQKEETINLTLKTWYPHNPWVLGEAICDHLVYKRNRLPEGCIPEYATAGIFAKCLDDMIDGELDPEDSSSLLKLSIRLMALTPSDYDGVINQLLRNLGEYLSLDILDSFLEDPHSWRGMDRIGGNDKRERFLDLLKEGKVKRIGPGVVLGDHEDVSAFCGSKFEESLKDMTVDEVKKVLLATIQSPPDGKLISQRARLICTHLSQRLPGGADEVHSFLEGENIDTYWKGSGIWP